MGQIRIKIGELMARVTYREQQQRMRRYHSDSTVGETSVPTRQAYQDSAITPSTESSNPYENNRWRLGAVAEIYSQLKPCKKSYWNHSWSKERITGAVGKKAVQLQSGYYLAFTKIINSLVPETGEYHDPTCFCIRLLDPVGNPFSATTRWTNFSSYEGTHTGYHVEYPVGKQWSGALMLKGVNNFNKLQSPVAITRSQVFFPWLQNFIEKDYITMWLPFSLRTIAGDYPLWECDNWLAYNRGHTIGSGSQSLKLRWCPFKCYGSLCAGDGVIVTLNYSDGGCNIEIEHPDIGDTADVYWNGEKLGEIKYGNKGKTITSSFFGEPFENMASQKEMLITEKQEPCMYNTVPPGMIQKGKLLKYETRGPECSGGGVGEHIYTYEFEHPINFSPAGRNPEIKVIVDGPYYDARGFQTFYEWGGIWPYVSNSPDGPWCNIWYNPSIVCEEGVQAYCFNHWSMCGGKYKYIRFFVDNGPYAWNHCTRTTIKDVFVNDKLWIPPEAEKY